jgi:hypothetical protein
MTIASCYLLPEGVVLASDSTTTMIEPDIAPNSPPRFHYYEHGQKIFEVGEKEKGTLAVATWGCGGLNTVSYRTVIAEFADDLAAGKAKTADEAIELWRQRFWSRYQTEFSQFILAAKNLAGTPPVNQAIPQLLQEIIRTLSVGFCLAGRYGPDRTPRAWVTIFSPIQTSPPVPQPLQMGVPYFWGQKFLVERLANGIDPEFVAMILNSGKWSGAPQDLFQILSQKKLRFQGIMPLRDAVELLYSMVDCTIKTMKFSQLPPTCGGPIEVAVITTDRPFRWVRHKPFGVALQRMHQRETDGL